MTLQEHLKQIFITALNMQGFSPDMIDNDEPLFGGRLELDSIDALEMVYQVERHFDIVMKDKNQARVVLRTINTLAAHITACQTAGS